MAETDGYYAEEVGAVMWRTSFNKQQRPDPQSRTKQVLPMRRLVQKKGRYFTTDTSDRQLKGELSEQTDREEKLAHPIASKIKEEEQPKKKQQFTGKNA